MVKAQGFLLLLALTSLGSPKSHQTSAYTPALPATAQTSTTLASYVNVQTALDDFLRDGEQEPRIRKGELAILALDAFAAQIYSTVPEYLHASLPHNSYLQAARRGIYGYDAHLRPKTSQEITSTAEKWMCAYLVTEFTNQIDRLFVSELLYSEDYSDDSAGLKDMVQDLRDHVEWIHALKKTDLLLMADDENSKYLRTYEQLYETCVTGNLAAITKV